MQKILMNWTQNMTWPSHADSKAYIYISMGYSKNELCFFCLHYYSVGATYS